MNVSLVEEYDELQLTDASAANYEGDDGGKDGTDSNNVQGSCVELEDGGLSNVDRHPASNDALKDIICQEIKKSVKSSMQDALEVMQQMIYQSVQQSIRNTRDDYDTKEVTYDNDDESELDDDDGSVNDSDYDDGSVNDSDYDDEFDSVSQRGKKGKLTLDKARKVDESPKIKRIFPHGYEVENLSHIPLALSSALNRQYVTSIFYDALYIVNGHLPARKLIKGKDYESTFAVKDIQYATKTFFSIVWKNGFRIVNLPYTVPFPDTLQARNWPSPQMFSLSVIVNLIQQYSHPDPERRFRIICRNEDETRMPFITRPPDSKGESAPDSFDLPDKKLPACAIPSDRCRCPLHLGDTNYWKKFMEGEYKPKRYQVGKSSAGRKDREGKAPLFKPITPIRDTPDDAPRNILPISTSSPATSSLKRPTQFTDTENRADSVKKRFKNLSQSSPSSQVASISSPRITTFAKPVTPFNDLQWRSDADVLKWATDTATRYNTWLEKGVCKEQQHKLYKRMIDMMIIIFTNTEPCPWSSFQSVMDHTKCVVNLVAKNPALYSSDGLALWLFTTVDIVRKRAPVLGPDGVSDIESFINMLVASDIANNVVADLRNTLMKIMEDNLFSV